MIEIRLTWPEILRAARWPGCVAITLGMCTRPLADALEAGYGTRFLLVFCVSFAAMRLLLRRAVDRALRRKGSSLDA